MTVLWTSYGNAMTVLYNKIHCYDSAAMRLWLCNYTTMIRLVHYVLLFFLFFFAFLPPILHPPPPLSPASTPSSSFFSFSPPPFPAHPLSPVPLLPPPLSLAPLVPFLLIFFLLPILLFLLYSKIVQRKEYSHCYFQTFTKINRLFWIHSDVQFSWFPCRPTSTLCRSPCTLIPKMSDLIFFFKKHFKYILESHKW